ncbi:hypothetical protein SAMN05660916_02301 [Arthrobacter sp. 31Cvi3.1E]|nr:hypothetical protein SAMN05660916_02301 [Arthrobacter sp. 31Cvi3.1E]
MKSADARTLEALSLNNRNPFTIEANHGLVEQVPPDMRLLHYTRTTIPAQYLPFFAFYHPKIGNIHLDRLPQVMHREIQYVIWSIVKGGGRVPCAGLGLLMRELAETSLRLKAEGQDWESLMVRFSARKGLLIVRSGKGGRYTKPSETDRQKASIPPHRPIVRRRAGLGVPRSLSLLFGPRQLRHALHPVPPGFGRRTERKTQKRSSRSA